MTPFHTTRFVAFTNLFSNVMRSKRFLSHLILTRSWCLKNNINGKSLHRHPIPSFVSSKSPFWLQLWSRETPQASHPETEAKRRPRCNQRRAAVAVCVRCELFTPRRDPRTDEPACISRRRARPFLPRHCRSERNQAYLSGLLWSSSQEGATRSVQVDRWGRTRNCSRSSDLAPNSNGSGPPPPSSRATHWEGPKWSPPLVPDSVLSGTVKGHETIEGYEEPYGIRGQGAFRPSTYVDFRLLGLTGGEENSYTLSTPHRIPRQGSAQASESFSEPVALQIRYTQTPVLLRWMQIYGHRHSTSPE